MSRSLKVTIAALSLAAAIGLAILVISFVSRLHRIEADVVALDRRSAAVARLDSDRVRQCLELSARWEPAYQKGDLEESDAYFASMAALNCGEVMDAIRRVR